MERKSVITKLLSQDPGRSVCCFIFRCH